MFDLVVLVGFRCVWFVFHCVVGLLFVGVSVTLVFVDWCALGC